MGLYGFLGTWLGQDVAAAALLEADEKGTATRTITYPLGNTERVEIFAAQVAAFFGINLAYSYPIRAIPAISSEPVLSNLLIPRTRAMYDIY